MTFENQCVVFLLIFFSVPTFLEKDQCYEKINQIKIFILKNNNNDLLYQPVKILISLLVLNIFTWKSNGIDSVLDSASSGHCWNCLSFSLFFQHFHVGFTFQRQSFTLPAAFTFETQLHPLIKAAPVCTCGHLCICVLSVDRLLLAKHNQYISAVPDTSGRRQQPERGSFLQ